MTGSLVVAVSAKKLFFLLPCLLVAGHGHVGLGGHGGSALVPAAAPLRLLLLPPAAGLPRVGRVVVHLLVAALLAAEGRVALVHEHVAVAGERLGAERAGVQRMPPGLPQRLRVEEESHGRRHLLSSWCVVWLGSAGRLSELSEAALLERLGEKGDREGVLILR